MISMGKSNLFLFREYHLAKNAVNIATIMQEASLLLKILQTKPQYEYKIMNFLELYYTVN